MTTVIAKTEPGALGVQRRALFKVGVNPRYEIIQVNSHFQYGNRHLQYLSENHPERIQKLLDEGNIYYYIAKLDRRITRAVDGQVRKWKESDTDYLTAVRNGDFLATNGLIINMTFRAEEAVLPTMLYA